MGNLERKQELIQEIMELIKEFRKEESVLGTDGLDSVKFDNENQVFIMENFGCIEKFNLNESSKIFAGEIDHGMLYEQVDEILTDAETDIEILTKKEFIELVGNALYAQYKCTAIHERLKEIEKEFSQMQ